MKINRYALLAVAATFAYGVILGLVHQANADEVDLEPHTGTEESQAGPANYPRFSIGVGGGPGIPAMIETGDVGGFINVNLGVRFNEYVQWDVFDFTGFRAHQEEQGTSYNVTSLGFGTAVRVGYFKKDSPINPYIIGGIGAGRSLWDFPGLLLWDWGVAGSIGFGAEVPLGDHFTIGASYRLHLKYDDWFDEILKLHAIGFELGWR
jgi:hypothetical protein